MAEPRESKKPVWLRDGGARAWARRREAYGIPTDTSDEVAYTMIERIVDQYHEELGAK